MPAPVVQVKRGALSNLPGLRAGEPAFTTDSFDFYVGIDSTTNNNKFVGSHRYWKKETASTGSGVNLVEATGGSDFITLAAPSSVGAAVTYTFPSTITDGYFLKTNSTGTLSWAEVVSNFNIAADTGTTDNVSTGSTITFVGGTNVNTAVTDNTITINLDNNISITDLNVTGITTLAGNVTLGDNTSDDITVGGEFVSSLNPSANNSYDLGTSSQRWRNGWFSGNVNVAGIITATGFTDLTIANKDIVMAYIDGSSETDTTANHGGIAVASTEGSPLFDISVIGINTLPSTYKQIMWVKSGTFAGLATDAWMFNYGVAIGTSTMANGVRLAVGTGVTISDTSVSATNFYGTFSGTSSSADQVKTVTASNTNATYHITFVDSHNGSATSETVYTDDGIYYNPGTNTFTTQHGYFTGNVTVDGTLTGTATTATRATTVDTTGIAVNQNYNLTFTDGSGTGKTVGVDAELLYNPNTNTLTSPNIKSGAIKASDGSSAITITNTTGAVGFANSVTISGDLYVLGTTTEVNTSTLKVEDVLVDLGLVNDNGVLVAPSSDLNLDVGILLNWYSGSAKKASVFWDDSAGRIGIASDISESSGVLTVNNWAAIEIGSLWVTDCAGTSQVISCTGAERFLENITVDCGTF